MCGFTWLHSCAWVRECAFVCIQFIESFSRLDAHNDIYFCIFMCTKSSVKNACHDAYLFVFLYVYLSCVPSNDHLSRT